MYVPPSGLIGTVKKSKVSSFNKKFSNTPLRMGVIVKCYEKDDEKSLTKLVPEYDVVTNELNKDNGQSYVKYSNCISTDTFGGVADFFEYKLRPSEQDFEENHNFKKQDELNLSPIIGHGHGLLGGQINGQHFHNQLFIFDKNS